MGTQPPGAPQAPDMTKVTQQIAQQLGVLYARAASMGDQAVLEAVTQMLAGIGLIEQKLAMGEEMTEPMDNLQEEAMESYPVPPGNRTPFDQAAAGMLRQAP